MKKINLKNAMQKYSIRDYKFSLVFLVIAISTIGIFMVGSAAPALMNRQMGGVIAGLIIMIVISLIDYRWILGLYWIMYVVNIVMLVSVLLFGENINGATRWLDLGFVQFQPIDVTKIIIILFYARFLTVRKEQINNKMTIIQGVALLVPTLVLVQRQPDLSNVITLIVLFALLMYLGGLSYKFIGTVLAIVIPVAIILLTIAIQPNQQLLVGYQQTRILAWLDPDAFAMAEAYQQRNSIMAIGSGQLTGKGYNSDVTTSLKNGNFILEPQTDFIFAIIGEELGFVGCSVIIILLLLIVIACILIGMKAKDVGGRIICGGVGGLIAVQSFINIAVTTGMFPNTGISLPFISYGLTSVISFYIGIGFVLNVGLQPRKH